MVNVLFVSVLPGVNIVSAAEPEVLREFYTGNGKSDDDNGYKPFLKVTVDTWIIGTNPFNRVYDATGIGGDNSVIYGLIPLNDMKLENDKGEEGYELQTWVSPGSYLYDT